MKRGRSFLLLFLGLIVILCSVTAWFIYRERRQERLNRDLIAAVKNSDTKAVISFLNQGADANCRDEPPRKPTLWQTLIQALHPRSLQPSHARTPLLLALKLWGPPDWDWSPPKGFGSAIPLVAAPPENVPLVRALLDHGAQVNQTDKDGMTPLVGAILTGKNDTVRLLLARGANANCRNEHGGGDYSDGPLAWAAWSQTTEPCVIADLLDHGADVNQRGSDGMSALLVATVADRVEVVRLLLTHHADPILPDKSGRTPLACALHANLPNSKQIIRLLQQAGANLLIKTPHGSEAAPQPSLPRRHWLAGAASHSEL